MTTESDKMKSEWDKLKQLTLVPSWGEDDGWGLTYYLDETTASSSQVIMNLKTQVLATPSGNELVLSITIMGALPVELPLPELKIWLIRELIYSPNYYEEQLLGLSVSRIVYKDADGSILYEGGAWTFQ